MTLGHASEQRRTVPEAVDTFRRLGVSVKQVGGILVIVCLCVCVCVCVRAYTDSDLQRCAVCLWLTVFRCETVCVYSDKYDSRLEMIYFMFLAYTYSQQPYICTCLCTTDFCDA